MNKGAIMQKSVNQIIEDFVRSRQKPDRKEQGFKAVSVGHAKPSVARVKPR